MSKNLKFISIVNGTEIEIDPADPEMPEEVRAYYIEYARQAEEELEDGVFEIPDDSVPEYVMRYIIGKYSEKLLQTMLVQDPETPVTDVDQTSLAAHIGLLCEGVAARTAGKALPEDRGAIIQLGRLFGDSFKVIIQRDEDWRSLTFDQAQRLYLGVVQAACVGMRVYGEVARKRKERGSEEGTK